MTASTPQGSREEPIVGIFGALATLDGASRERLLDRGARVDSTVRTRVSAIIERVRHDGDAALLALAEELDGVRLAQLEVPRRVLAASLDGLETGLRRALERSLANIDRVHRAWMPVAMETEGERGVVIGRRPDPLRRVGVYAPGGRAAYPSSVLMGVAPAKVAGVGEVILCSPPLESTGRPWDVVLAAAALSGADRVFSIGGAGAIAAMALGTASVPRVDRIVGPGNAYVAEAKLQVANRVGIDSPAGPSELLVLCDEGTDLLVAARELLAQAEHDPLAAVIAMVTTEAMAVELRGAIARMLPEQARSDIVRAALRDQGAILWSHSPAETVAFANDYAPEHLLLLVGDADRVLERVRNAGTVFIGASSSVAFGDYMTGANHVLPTGGLARCYSGLSTADFVRWTSYQRVSAEAAARLADDTGRFAEAEGLDGHARAARAWSVAAAGAST